MSQASNHKLETYFSFAGEEYPVIYSYRFYPAEESTRYEPGHGESVMLVNWKGDGWEPMNDESRVVLNRAAHAAWEDSYTQSKAIDGAMEDIDYAADQAADMARDARHDSDLWDNMPIEYLTESAIDD